MYVFNEMLDKLILCQKAIEKVYAGEVTLRKQVQGVIRGVNEFEYALQRLNTIFKGYFS